MMKISQYMQVSSYSEFISKNLRTKVYLIDAIGTVCQRLEIDCKLNPEKILKALLLKHFKKNEPTAFYILTTEKVLGFILSEKSFSKNTEVVNQFVISSKNPEEGKFFLEEFMKKATACGIKEFTLAPDILIRHSIKNFNLENEIERIQQKISKSV